MAPEPETKCAACPLRLEAEACPAHTLPHPPLCRRMSRDPARWGPAIRRLVFPAEAPAPDPAGCPDRGDLIERGGPGCGCADRWWCRRHLRLVTIAECRACLSRAAATPASDGPR